MFWDVQSMEHPFVSNPADLLSCVCAGAGSFTEPSDGGWNMTTGAVSAYKPALKYSNVRMRDGGSFTGNIVARVTATTFKVRQLV